MRKFLLTGLVYLVGTMAFGQWNPDPTVNNLMVSVANKGTGQVSNPIAANDGEGGMFIAWIDNRNSVTTGNDLFIIRILANGNIAPGFAAGGNVVSNATGNQSNPAMVDDGAGGVIITWQDPANANDIIAQRVAANGSFLWGNGITVATGANSQNTPSIAKISNLNVAIVWRYTGTTTSTDLAANYFAIADGAKVLANDVVVVEAANIQSNQAIVGDGSGGVIIIWTDARLVTNQVGIRAERLGSTGLKLWGESTGGLSVRPEGGSNTTGPALDADGSGGAVIAWSDNRNGSANADIYVQHVSAGGNLEWGNNAIIASSAAPVLPDGNGQQLVPNVSKSGNQFIVAWNDQRISAIRIDIYAQAFNVNGEKLWGTGGEPIAITSAEFNQPATTTTQPVLLPDGSGGAFFVWDDRRLMIDNPSPTPDIIEEDIYAQKVNSNGTLLWNATGVAVSIPFGSNQNNPMVVNSTDNSFLIAWRDSRSTNANSEIYASRLQSDGLLPVSILELGAQAIGKNVAVTWTSANERALSHFEVERSADGISFTRAGNVVASNSPGRHSYRFDDLNPMNGNNYYRIRSVDRDGTETFSNIAKVSIVFSSDKALLLYPNPAVVNANLQLNNLPGGSYSIRIVDMQGRLARSLMIELNGASQTIQVPVGNLGGGIYQVQVINARGEQVAREALLKQ